ncbi:hypothetical protein PHYC_01600 [Phycisphaerales bacterium]|nr:hypothetical protein PHYC_01600 [Phycisphaerales bacterium]
MPSRQSFPVARALVLAILVPSLSALPSCTPAPPIAEPFNRDRSGSAARAYQAALDANTSAADALSDALASLTDRALEGAKPYAAYDSARRLLIRVENRFAFAKQRLDAAETRGEELIEQWQAERRLYTDEGLRDAADKRLETMRERKAAATESLGAAHAALRPALAELSDRTLFLKHCRDLGVLQPAPISEEGRVRYLAAREGLDKARALAKARVAEFLAALGQVQ